MDILLNSRQMSLNEVLSLRVDRDQETSDCVDSLAKRGQSIFLWGVRGIGKTFLVRLIEAELRKFSDILTVNVDVLELPGFGRTNPIAAFPEVILLSICKAVWKDILGKPYSELRSTLDLHEGNLRAPCKLTHCVETIYTQVMASQRKAKYEQLNSIGFSAAAKAEKRETNSIEQIQPPLLPFEFFEYCEELLEALRDKGKTRVIALCDEANILPLDQQKDILSRYIALFSSRRVQFLFVAGVLSDEGPELVAPEGFDSAIKVIGLAIPDTVKLVTKAGISIGCNLPASSFKRIAKRCAGNPRIFLEVCLQAKHISIARGLNLNATILQAACTDVLKRLNSMRVEFDQCHDTA